MRDFAAAPDNHPGPARDSSIASRPLQRSLDTAPQDAAMSDGLEARRSCGSGNRHAGHGWRAPEFTLPDQDGQSVSLSALLRYGTLILYFYPADFTPGCTREACSIRDLHAEIQEAGLSVAGVSPQGPESHRAFREQHKLPFVLLSDVDKCVIRMYDVRGPLGFGVRRATYLVDQARYIRSAVLADFRISQHEDFIHRAVALSAGGTRRPRSVR